MSAHICHAVGCSRAVRPEMLMCRPHWFMVPQTMRHAVLISYRRGQCDDKKPSQEWLVAARAAINWVYDRERT